MALLQRTFAAVRQGVLGQMRLAPSLGLQSEAAAPMSLQFLRMFAADASYLDKKDVTDRVLNVVKNFEKVDEGKVSRLAGRCVGCTILCVDGWCGGRRSTRWTAAACPALDRL